LLTKNTWAGRNPSAPSGCPRIAHRQPRVQWKSLSTPAAKWRSSPATFHNRKTNMRGRVGPWLDYPVLFHITSSFWEVTFREGGPAPRQRTPTSNPYNCLDRRGTKLPHIRLRTNLTRPRALITSLFGIRGISHPKWKGPLPSPLHSQTTRGSWVTYVSRFSLRRIPLRHPLFPQGSTPSGTRSRNLTWRHGAPR
jgi:hypothetical protein